MSPPPRIAHLIECDGPGGAERMVASLAIEQQQAGIQTLVILPANGEGWLEAQLAGSGVATEHFRLDRPVSLACARWLADVLREHRISLAHCHEFSMGVYGAWAAWLARIPHLVTMHGGRYFADRLRRRVALRAGAVLGGYMVAVSHELARQLRRDLWLPASRVSTIPNGVRYVAATHSTLRDELDLAPEDRLAVAVGNLYSVKGHRFAVEALALLQDSYPRLHLAIAGRGDMADSLLRHAEQRGVAARLHLIGLRADIPNVLAGADLFVLPSLSEGLPLALLEAMFAARPIVASDVGEVRAVLGDGAAGVLVPAGDATALAAALAGVLAAPEQARELGARAKHRATTDYGIASMVARYKQLYDRLLPARESPETVTTAVTAR
ncbi:MAG TPA: glycosyltransferase [Gemmatimonadales bacterium]|nr:glycosyltransferase [Gemmatimonadales bacterium]